MSETKSEYPNLEAVEREEWRRHLDREAAERAAVEARRKASEYPLPVLTGTAKLAPADDPWEGMQDWSVDALAALERADAPPEDWLSLQPETRRHLAGLAEYLLRVCPPIEGKAGERRGVLRSIVGAVIITLSEGATPAGLGPVETKFLSHFAITDPASREIWTAIRHELHRVLGQHQHALFALLDQLDRPDPIAAIKRGIVAALAAMEERFTGRDPYRA